MLSDKIWMLTFVLHYGISSSFLVGKKENQAEEIEKFPHVEHHDNDTLYLFRDNMSFSLARTNSPPPPDHYDWRDKNIVGPVKDQKRCEACWAFSTAACIECHLALYNKKRVQLSEQFLIDCILEGKDDAPGCGQFPLTRAYSEILSEFGGVLALSDYRPYSASARQCTYKKPPPIPQPISGFIRVSPNEDAMVIALYVHGPLSAAINSKSMDKYQSGSNYIDEPTEEQCSPRPEDMDHSIIIVGYNVYVDSQKKVPYWIIKNSWGTEWGDNGYYYLVRGRNACGIANDVYFPIVPT